MKYPAALAPRARYLYHLLRQSSPREHYWEFTALRNRHAKLRRPEFASFARHVQSEGERLEASLAAADSRGDTAARLAAAVAWVLLAQLATPDPGVSLGYFPLDLTGGWHPSYPGDHRVPDN